MSNLAAAAEIAALVADPARMNMLCALMSGRALTAGELARAAGVTPQTASGHLARLKMAGLVVAERHGRSRYHRLGAASVAGMLESIMAVAAVNGEALGKRLVVGPRDKALRLARTCYDHLAGKVAVDIADRMTKRGYVDLAPDSGVVTKEGMTFLRSRLGIDAAMLGIADRGRSRRIFCKPCLDWSERRPHIAGAVGAAICSACFGHGWIRRLDGVRAVAVTTGGRVAMREIFDFEVAP
ncbi:MAG TPA: winged helix-turn-helix domain-containing protein [Roseiarcus sp.]|nr:winged helix-turn-helix domain-containing protein [Roseiarcus sp.]